MLGQENGARDDPLGRILSYLVAITTILGIPAGLYGYFLAQHATRVERTFDFYKDFRGTELQTDFSLLVDVWNAQAAQEQKLLDQKNYEGLHQLVVSMLKKADAQKALNDILQFFEEMSSCVENSLCDANSTLTLLKSSADQIVSMYGFYLLDVQKNNPSYAQGLLKVRGLTKSWWSL